MLGDKAIVETKDTLRYALSIYPLNRSIATLVAIEEKISEPKDSHKLYETRTKKDFSCF